MITTFLKGFIVGMGASIPLGPMGIVCVQKTLSKGRHAGMIAGLGSSVTDTIFAAIAILGLAYIKSMIVKYEDYLLLFGGIIVGLIGMKIFLTNPIKQIRYPMTGKKHLTDFFSSMAMTLSNPGSLFLILGLFAFVGVNTDGIANEHVISSTLIGVFLGTATWWFILSATVSIFRKKFRLRQLVMINRISGIIIFILGLVSLFEGAWRLIVSYFHLNNFL
ncbi:MAG TPA: LysE family transporter [Bacteroidales bacterium]|jgi:threonine/homoserine/homoserine lactone efflux protein|nr:LysE family transporter [Bacteroidales bacterium]HRR49390.1 LysE family transporter [Bacteroidales bacterium]HRT34149.1 LysE family transporter [Bacteroidales bacterium]HRT84222.1 LysE family transporter [Bacteroidales bacterium]